MGIVIGITNQKGGVGKTTSAVNISACLSAANKKTLLVDMDPQGNSTSGVGIDKKSAKITTYELLLEKITSQSAIIQTQYPNLFLIPADIRLIGAEIELINLSFREYRLKLALNAIIDNFDYIIIDTPPSLGILTLNSLVFSDYLIIPVQAEYYALEGLSLQMDTIKRVQTNLNQHLKIGGILVTMFDSRTNLAQQVFQELKRHFGDLVFNTQIPRSVRFGEAPSFGKPIIYYDFHSLASDGYIELTGEIIDRFEGDKL